MNILINTSGITEFFGQKIPYQIGKYGLTSDKQEGDKKTPIGFLKPLILFYRAGRVIPPQTFLPIAPINLLDGWCDAPQDKAYNQYVKHPFRASAEKLMRDDCLYDMILVTDYNYPFAVPYKGSAIFIHVMHPEKKPTQGCIAFRKQDLKRIISALRPHEGFFVEE